MNTHKVTTMKYLKHSLTHFLGALRGGALGGALAGALLGAATLAHAGFSISGTRVIYHDAQGEATVHMQRVSGQNPVLLQVWLDDGDAAAKPGTQNLPFVLTPAVSRVEPDRAQVIRILRTRDDLPGDRESLLFFNALEVPASDNAAAPAGTNSLRLAMQARMKFFYRPKDLQPAVEKAADLLRFTLALSAEGKPELRLHNPTPYYLTVPEVSLHANKASDAPALAAIAETATAPMVAPFSDLTVPLNNADLARLGPDTQVRYTVINDLGGHNAKQGSLSDAS